VRRIFPALITVLTAVLAIGWCMLLPNELAALGKQTAASATFVVNVLFWLQAGYFDPRMESSLLLHIWSLAVEEQFYLLWPLLIVWVASTRRTMTWLVGALLAGSFVLNAVLVVHHETATFFLLPTRWWELMAGGILAQRVVGASSDGAQEPMPRMGDALAWTGIALVIAAFAIVHRDRHFPGGWALLPVIGTCCVIAAGPQAFINRVVLASRVPVGIGLVSYPLYLWHWPALTLLRIVEAGRESAAQKAIALTIAVALAVATYRWIERPLRARSARVAIPLVAIMALVGAAGWLVANGFVAPRIDDATLARFDRAAQDWDFPGARFRTETTADGLRVYTIGTGLRKVVILGDSIAQQYAPRIDALVRGNAEREVQVSFATTGNCPPLPGVQSISRTGCADFIASALRLARDPSVSTVLIAAQWPGYVGSPDYTFMLDGRAQPLDANSATLAAALEAFGRTLRDLKQQGKQVVVVLNIPAGVSLDPRYVLHRRWTGGVELRTEGLDRAWWTQHAAAILQPLERIAREAGARVIDPVAELCQAARCPAVDDNGDPIYRDAFHLRASFVRTRVGYLDDVVLGR